MGISQIVYSASLLDISPDNISRNKRAIFNFIYNIASKFVWSNSIAWACFIFLLCMLMTSANKSLGKKIEIVIKQLVHTSYEARGKFGEHSRSWSCPRRSREQLLRIFRALQTSRVLHISMNARWCMNQLLIGIRNKTTLKEMSCTKTIWVGDCGRRIHILNLNLCV